MASSRMQYCPSFDCRALSDCLFIVAENLFHQFSESTRTANKEVLDFKTLMSDEETKKVLEQARKSRAANPNNVKPWRAMDHPDWLTRDDK